MENVKEFAVDFCKGFMRGVPIGTVSSIVTLQYDKQIRYLPKGLRFTMDTLVCVGCMLSGFRISEAIDKTLS